MLTQSTMKYDCWTGRYLFNCDDIRAERLKISLTVKHFFKGNPSRPQDGIQSEGYLRLAQLIAEQSQQVEFYHRALCWYGLEL